MPVVRVSRLTQIGRTGNQIILYLFARAYADRIRATLETPSWIGQRMFDLHDDAISGTPVKAMPDDFIPTGQGDIDVYGFYQNPVAMGLLTTGTVRHYLKIKQEWLQRYPGLYSCDHPIGADGVTAHLRRGDYLRRRQRNRYCIIREECYFKEIERHGYAHLPLDWVREDRPRVEPEVEAMGMGFMPDFMKLVNANILFRANSSFSWVAAALTRPDTVVFSPVVEDMVGWNDVQFVRGNWPRIAHATRVNNPHISDLRLGDE
jgi:hypothetical protein